MLKAYDYAEPVKNKIEIKDSVLFQREKQIAQNFVISNPIKYECHSCPICGSEHTKFIFERWDINYRYCDICKSIFVPVEQETLKKYLELKEIKELKTSKEYQKQASERRNSIWNDLVLWAEYRIFRYLGRNTELNIIDFGNKYEGFIDLFCKSKLIGNYELRNSFLDLKTNHIEQADVILYLNQLQHENDPIYSLSKIRESLLKDGLLILNTRLGSGFDILTLKGGTQDIFPYEHIMLPSKKGLEIILDRAGFELLEITTPGTRDMDIVMKHKERIEDSNFFIKYLIDIADVSTIADFQQFLQKSGLSSFAQVVARKR